MNAAYWVALAAILALTVVFALIDYRIADKLRAAQEERDRQTALAETWHTIAEARAALSLANRDER